MVEVMKYQCKVIINANLEKVIELFLEHMVQNKELKVGNETIFSYDINEHHVLVMKETIESINLPYEIVTIYEVEDVWNRCVNRFKRDKIKLSIQWKLSLFLKTV